MATVTLKNIQQELRRRRDHQGRRPRRSRTASSCVFVGPSGCGKSTLLRMIAGLEEITSGDLLIDGQRVNDVPPAERGLAMVFQSYALYPHMTVADNMGFSLRLAGVPKEERDAQGRRGGASVLHLDQLLDRKPKELSGGQRQRVAIGRAIVRKPKVFLFDEPLSNLDAALRVQMRIELARLHDELKATMIYVTHDQVEAMTMADKIVVLQAGIDRAGRLAARALPPPAQPVRRRLHRQPEDELPAGQGDRRRQRQAPRSSCRRRLEHHRAVPARRLQAGRQRHARRPARASAAGRDRRDRRRGDGGRAARRRDLPLHPDRRRRDAGHPGRRRDPDPGAREDHGQARPAHLPSVRLPPASRSSARQRHPLADMRRTSGRKAS